MTQENEIRDLINLIRQSAHVEHDNMLILESLKEALAADPGSVELQNQVHEHELLITTAAGTIEGYTRWLIRLVGIE